MARIDRQQIIQEMLNLSINSVGVNPTIVAALMLSISSEIVVWELTGIDVVTPKLLEMIDVGHVLKPALLTIVNVEGETMQESITRQINETTT